MSEQPQLFDIRRETVDVCANPRQTVIDSALEKADEKFKRDYTELLMSFVNRRVEFIGEDVRRRWVELGRPQPREWRCVGGLYQQLQRKGLVEIVTYRKREQGNMTAVYRGK